MYCIFLINPKLRMPFILFYRTLFTEAINGSHPIESSGKWLVRPCVVLNVVLSTTTPTATKPAAAMPAAAPPDARGGCWRPLGAINGAVVGAARLLHPPALRTASSSSNSLEVSLPLKRILSPFSASNAI